MSAASQSPSTPSYDSTTFTHIINGQPVTSSTTYDVINPATGQVIGKAPEADAAQVDEAVLSARAAFPGWKSKTWAERKDVLRSIAHVLEDKEFSAELVKALVLEIGRPIFLASAEISLTLDWIRGSLSLSLEEDNVLVDDDQIKIYTRHVPLGVAVGLVPWNFPVLMVAAKIVTAFLTGNTLIIKPSPFAPLSSLMLVAKIQHLLPPGVLSILSGGSDLGKLLTAHPGVDKVAFTGSIPTGKSVLESASYTLKRVTLELGGNDPCIILPDANPAKIAGSIFIASFMNSGQICTAAKRIYVHEAIYDDFLAALVECTKNMKMGDPFDPSTILGPVCNEIQYNIVRGLINDCRTNGYKFAAGGDIDLNAPGYFIPATIVDNPPDDSRIVQEEPFGPIVPVLKWKDEDEVIRRANDTKNGLAASVWGKDVVAVQRIADRMEAGTVWLNDCCKLNPLAPFPGHKESGLGVEGGLEGLKEWCNIQTFSINKTAEV